jgi:TonB family protein
MKVCPKCAQSFADGFTYCPKDATPLEKYDPRSRLHQPDELNFLLESESLLSRLKRELVNAIDELKHNPRSFLKGLLRGEGSTRNRKRLLQAGIATAVITYTSVFMTALLIGLIKLPASDRGVTAAPDPAPLNDVTFLLPVPVKPERAKGATKSGAGMLGGSLPQRQRPGGGGGGNDQKRASAGVAPLASLNPQQAQPDFNPPQIPHTTLIIRPSVYADPNTLLRVKGPMGMPDGQPDAPSRGDGPGTGFGPGKGPGYGPGEGGNSGNGKNRIGGGPTTGSGDEIAVMSPSLKPTILYREKAKYTEEARQQRVQGSVLLSVVFGADGRLHDIRVVRGLPHGLTETSIEAANRIRFQPAIQNGKPVSVRATLEFNFALY